MIVFDIYRRNPAEKNRDVLMANCKTESIEEFWNIARILSKEGCYFVIGGVFE